MAIFTEFLCLTGFAIHHFPLLLPILTIWNWETNHISDRGGIFHMDKTENQSREIPVYHTREQATVHVAKGARRHTWALEKSVMALLALVTMGYAAMFGMQWYDTDADWMIATGRYIIQNGIPYENPFTIVGGMKIVVQQWAYCATVTWVYDTFGNVGPAIMVSLMEVVFVLLAHRLVKMLSGDGIVAWVAAFLMAASFPYHNIRPELVTAILLLAQCILQERHRQTGQTRWLYGIPVLVVLEMNLHAAMWPIHAAVMLPYVTGLPRFLLKKARRTHAMGHGQGGRAGYIIPCLLSAGALFLNPYGTDGMAYVFRSCLSGIGEYGIAELEGLQFSISYRLPYTLAWLCVLVAVTWLLAIGNIGKSRPLGSATLYMSIGFLVFALPHVRNTMFLMFPIAYLMGEARGMSYGGRDGRTMTATLCAAAIIIIFPIKYTMVSHTVTIDDKDERWAPVTEWLARNAGDDPVVYTPFSYGAVLERAGYKIFTDARPELYNSAFNAGNDLFLEFEKRDNKDGEWNGEVWWIKGFIEKYGFDYLVIGTGDNVNFHAFMAYAEASGEWEALAETTDGKAILYGRALASNSH